MNLIDLLETKVDWNKVFGVVEDRSTMILDLPLVLITLLSPVL